MSRSTGRRSRTLEPEDQDASRESTPISTARNDRKRARRTPMPDEDLSPSPSALPLRSTNGNIRTQNSMRVRSPHQPGAIVRVKLTNFVTYTSAEFFPGPNLNMVIGPNGTGKSTLVCAICLGLGWGPQLLGRAKDPAEFVKHGCKEATIEIELQRAYTGSRKTSSNPVITRVIKKDNNKSSFSMNGSSTTNKAVLELVRKFNIQVDNLCQFLPQDRVVEFAQMNPVQMLESTLQAAAEPSILEFHGKLKGLREQQRELMMDNKGDRENLANLEKRQESQRLEVERLKERLIVQKKIEWLEKCRTLAKYTVAKKKHAAAKERRDNLRAELSRLKHESAPVLRKVQAKKDYREAAKDHLDFYNKNVIRSEKECERLEREIKKYEVEAKDCDQQIEAEKAGVRKDKEELVRTRQLIIQLKNQKKNPPEQLDNKAVNEDMKERNARIRELVTRGQEGQTRVNELMIQGKERSSKAEKLKDRLKSLDTQSGQQETKLENESADTYKAWKWIQENQDKLTKKAFGPPIIECSIKDAGKANVIEALLSRNDFKIITVQCHEDFVVLQREFTQNQRLHDFSLRTCSYDDISHVKKPMSLEELQTYGLEQWAIDYIEGPGPVLAMLCQERSLHSCAIASRNVSSDQHEAISKSALRSYVAGNRVNRFTKRPEYGSAGAVANVQEVKPARFWSDQPIDMGRKAAIERQIAEIKGEYKELAREVQKLKQEVEEIVQQRTKEEDELSQVRADKDAKQKAMTAYNGLDVKIENKEEQLQKCEDRIGGVKTRCLEIQSAKEAAMLARAEEIVKYCQAIHLLKELNAKWLEAELLFIEAQSDYENLDHQNEHLKKAIQQKTKESEEALAAVRSATQEGRALIDDFEMLQAEAAKLKKDGESGLNDLMETLAANAELTERVLDDDLEAERARLELSEGGNANVVKEFEARARKITDLQENMKIFNEKQAEFIQAIREVRQYFEKELDPIVAKINDAFSDSFARIGCAGQVTVFKASSDDPADCTEEMGGVENGLDFANWAIHISVKFRESEPLSLLDSHRQSGGERAVSTIFYLMALQSLSRSPFRVVDEINQGMDPRNERMVHGRMVDIAAADNNDGEGQGGQYFLITPKLLNGLKYRRGMTVLCIVSGENMPAVTETTSNGQRDGGNTTTGHRFDFNALAKRARTLGLADFDSGRRMDSGVGLGSSFGSMNRLEVGA